MLKNYFKIRWLALPLLALSMGACKKCDDDPPPVPNDPCANIARFNKSNMRIYMEGPSLFDSVGRLYSDTIWMGENPIFPDSVTGYGIKFRLNGTFDSVKWKVGQDFRTFTAPAFGLNFNGNIDPYERIDVQAVVFRKPRPDCIPNDNGRDTIKNHFVLVPTSYIENRRVALLGLYNGYIVGKESDTFTIKIHRFTDQNGNRTQHYITNLPKGNIGLAPDRTSIGAPGQGEVLDPYTSYRGHGFFVGTTTRLIQQTLFCYLTTRDSIHAQFQEYEGATGNRMPIKRFVGVRVN